MMVVETDDINRTALKEMIIGRRLLTTCRDGTRDIVALHYLCQVLGHQALYGALAILSQCRGVMPCIQNQVGLFKRQRVSLGRRPLFQHLVAYRPHQNAWMVTVAQDEVA